MVQDGGHELKVKEVGDDPQSQVQQSMAGFMKVSKEGRPWQATDGKGVIQLWEEQGSVQSTLGCVKMMELLYQGGFQCEQSEEGAEGSTSIPWRWRVQKVLQGSDGVDSSEQRWMIKKLSFQA
ncbi:hypothetical protein YC2023_072074 [Brassica napus]